MIHAPVPAARAVADFTLEIPAERDPDSAATESSTAKGEPT